MSLETCDTSSFDNATYKISYPTINPSQLPRRPPPALTRGTASGSGSSVNDSPYMIRYGEISSTDTVYTHPDIVNASGLESRLGFQPQGPCHRGEQTGPSSSQPSLASSSHHQMHKRRTMSHSTYTTSEGHSYCPRSRETGGPSTSKYTPSALSCLAASRSYSADGASTKYTPSLLSFFSGSQSESIYGTAINSDQTRQRQDSLVSQSGHPRPRTTKLPKLLPNWLTSNSNEPQDPEFQRIKHLNVTGKIKVNEKIAYGGYSDVWRGTLRTRQGDVEVAIKELRIRSRQGCTLDPERLKKRFYREIILWDLLRHPNIVPLFGFAISIDTLPWLVSPWYCNGNIVDYLNANPEAQRHPLLFQVANALKYLHSRPLVHGDLKGDNILIDASGSASLCDFGMSKFVEDAVHITGFTTTTVGGGTVRFLCPELLEDQPRDTMTDMWAFGCVVIQIMADLAPYWYIERSDAVHRAIMLYQPPLLPGYDPPTDARIPFWDMIRRCWNVDPISRPNIVELLDHIETAFPDLQTQDIVTSPISGSPGVEQFSTKILGTKQNGKRSLIPHMKEFLARNKVAKAWMSRRNVPETLPRNRKPPIISDGRATSSNGRTPAPYTTEPTSSDTPSRCTATKSPLSFLPSSSQTGGHFPLFPTYIFRPKPNTSAGKQGQIKSRITWKKNVNLRAWTAAAAKLLTHPPRPFRRRRHALYDQGVAVVDLRGEPVLIKVASTSTLERLAQSPRRSASTRYRRRSSPY